MSFFGGHNSSFLGPEVTYDSETGTLFHSESLGGHSRPGHGGGGGTAPPPVLVTSAGSNLEFKLIWDSSVASAPSSFMTAVQNVAQYYEYLFSTSKLEVINIQVGWGEVAGQALPSGALGASETNGYLTNYSYVTSHLSGYSFSASNEPTGSQFFISSAEAKSFGLISSTSTGVDGYIGFGTLTGTGYSYNFASSASTGLVTGTGATQFGFASVVQHEISEVLGRIEMEGHSTFNGQATYTPLDLFNYSSYDSTSHTGTLALYSGGSGGPSYFSIDNGATHLANFNDGTGGGDIADWSSYAHYTDSGTFPSGVQDAYDAFAYPGVNSDLSTADYDVDLTLGLLGISGHTIS